MRKCDIQETAELKRSIQIREIRAHADTIHKIHTDISLGNLSPRHYEEIDHRRFSRLVGKQALPRLATRVIDLKSLVRGLVPEHRRGINAP